MNGYAADAWLLNLSMATARAGNHFECLAFTLEMPFKDNANLPDDDMAERASAACAPAAILQPVYAVLNELRGA